MYLCILSYFLNQFYYSYIKKFQSHSKRTDENGLIFLTIIKSENICKIYGLKPLCSQSVLAVRFMFYSLNYNRIYLFFLFL